MKPKRVTGERAHSPHNYLCHMSAKPMIDQVQASGIRRCSDDEYKSK